MNTSPLFFSKKRQKRTILPMIVLCNVAILFLFILDSHTTSLPPSWNNQFILLLIFNFILSLFTFIIPHTNRTWGTVVVFIFTAQLGCKYIMTKPFGDNIWFEFFLIIILLLEGILLLSTPEIFFLTGLILFSILFTKYNEIFWEIQMKERSWELRLSLVILTLTISGLCLIIRNNNA